MHLHINNSHFLSRLGKPEVLLLWYKDRNDNRDRDQRAMGKGEKEIYKTNKERM
jgi:hypothetical protein